MVLTYAIKYPQPGNLLIRSKISPLPHEDVRTFDALAISASNVQLLYQNLKINVNPSSVLARLLKHCHKILEAWKRGEGQNVQAMIDASNTGRIVDSILEAGTGIAALELLKRIAKNDIDLAAREISQGKDALWELELLLYLRRRNIRVQLQEPDLRAVVGNYDFPIACKKIYSEKKVGNQMSSGAQQLQDFTGKGIIALNIDDLIPGDTILTAPTLAVAEKKMHEFILSFLGRHQHKIRDFLKLRKCEGVLVSASCPSDITYSKPRINNHIQVVFWSPATWLSDESKDRMSVFRSSVESSQSRGI